MNLLVNFLFLFWISKISSEAAPEGGNDVMVIRPYSYNPPHLAKQRENKDIAPSFFWPEISFLERILKEIITPPRLQHKTTQKPRIVWRFFSLTKRNATDKVLAVTTLRDQDSMGSTDPPLNSTENKPETNILKRHKKDKGSRPAAPALVFDLLNLGTTLKNASTSSSEVNQKIADNGKHNHKLQKTKIDKRYLKFGVLNRNGINYYFNKSANSTQLLNCYRRFYTYVWTIDWSSLFIHIILVLIFVFILSMALAYCQALANSVQVNVKRIKVNPGKLNKGKGLETRSMC